MTFIQGTPGVGTTPTLDFTVPPGVTSGMVGVIVFSLASGTDWDPVPFKSGATFTLVDDRAATNLRVTVWSGTGLVAGDVVTVSATIDNQANVWHLYTDEFTVDVPTLAAGVRGGSTAVTVSGSVTPDLGQTVLVIASERTTATGSVVSSVVSSGGETITDQLFSEQPETVTSTYMGTFVASAAASRTVTITHNSASTNGYCAVVEVVSAAVPTPVPPSDFPNEPLAVVVQAKFDGTNWTDITDDALVRSPITVKRGKSDEQSKAEPSKVGLTLRNPDGRYSPRNPSGPYYGKISRNTELRVGVSESSTWLDCPGPTGAVTVARSVSTPDHASLDITGDLDIRFDADLDSWHEDLDLVSKGVESTNQRSYWFRINADGLLYLYRSVTGTSWSSAVSTRSVPVVRGRLAVRATLDVDNGSGGRTTTFYTAPTMAGPWEQLGLTGVGTGVISIFASTAPLVVLDNPTIEAGFSRAVRGRVYGVEVRDGIGGTVVAGPDFTTLTSGDASFTDAPGRLWTLNGPVKITNLDVRGHGEVPAWPQKWDLSGKDVWTPIEAAGITRRLGQGAAPLSSPLKRGMTSGALSGVVAYWPVEDLAGASVISTALANGRTMSLAGDDNTTFSSSEVIPGSDSIAVLGDKSSWVGSVRPVTATGKLQMWWVMQCPAGGLTNNEVLISLATTGTVGTANVTYSTGGNLRVVFVDPNTGSTIGTVGPYAYAADGLAVKMSLDLTQNGSDVDVELKMLVPGASGGVTGPGTISSRTVGRAVSVEVSPGAGTPDLHMGHISVHTTIYSLYAQGRELAGWVGEVMGRRIERLCSEEDIPFRLIGNLDATVPGGIQKSLPVLELLQEAADADGGILAESRDDLSLMFVPRKALQQDLSPMVSVPYGSMVELDPIEDDESTRNDITVIRDGGSSFRVEQTTGGMSTSAPPTGIGRYQVSETYSLASDAQLPDYAHWRLSLGTVDELRYPSVGFALEHPDIASDAVVVSSLRRADLGQRLELTGPFPAWLPPDPVDTIIIGSEETLGVYDHSIVYNCVPGEPYRIGMWTGGAEHRWGGEGSTITSSITTTATSVSVSFGTGVRWVTDPAEFPFDARIGAEVVTVTAITGTTSPQTATVTRSVNGVVLAHPAGTSFDLAYPVYYSV